MRKVFDAERYINLKPGISVGAADVGYGYTKFGFNNRDKAKFELMMFGSLATVSREQVENSRRIRVGGDLDVVKIGVNGTIYEVGPEAHLNQGERTLGDDYTDQPEHLALLRGALSYTNKSVFDIFVVGLPVTHMRNRDKIERLKGLVVGTHEVGGGRQCAIKKVVVLPQPQGCFISYALSKQKYSQLKNERTLVIDPGQYTYDYYVCEGKTAIDHLCGSHNLSMSKILADISKNISSEIEGHFSGGKKLEEAIKRGSIKINQREFKIEEFITEQTKGLIKDAVVRMGNELEGIELIDNVLICGGAGKLFKPYVEDALKLEVQVADDPIFENLRGYLLAGAIQSNNC